jgi:uncharacterized membrane protein
MQQENLAVSIFKSHQDAEAAVKTLERAGINLKQLSIVGRDYHTEEHVVGYYNSGDRIKYWGKNGAFWGAIWGWLFGAAFFFIPGLGPMLIAGPLVSGIVGALEGAVVVGGLSALGAALYGIGIPKNSVLEYEAALKAEKFLLLVHGTAEEVARAKEVLQSQTAATQTDTHLHGTATPVPVGA